MANIRLLIIDDEPDIRELLQQQTSELVSSAETAASGLEALEILKHREFEVILCDISMPKMTGVQLLIEIRKLGIDTPFIFLTGHGTQAAVEDAWNFRAFDYLEKPWKESTLKAIVERAGELGMQMLQWKDDPTIQGSLNDVRQENAARSDVFHDKIVKPMNKAKKAGAGN